MDVEGPRRGNRDNGLRCANYAPVADLDPRIVDTLLDALRDEGIAAYAAPTPAVAGGAMELRLPSRPIDRLWVDDTQLARAKDLVDRESSGPPVPAPASGPTDIDFESAWQGVLASLQATPGAETPSWPEEDAPPEPGESYDPADQDHFEPPPPPPLPRLRKATLGALAVMAFGLLILATNVAGGSLRVVGVLALLGGVASLVWNMRQGPPTDSGWDDGAVV
jgi:hypothetical protein